MLNGELESVVARLVHQVERRYFGKYRGFVVNNDDPLQLGRLKLTVPSVLGDAVVTGWAMPCVPYGGADKQGFFFIPEVDAGVWVEFEEGDLEFPIWVGTFWAAPGGTTEVPAPNDQEGAETSVQSPPTCKIIKTLAGHTLQFEDADEEVRILLGDGPNDNRIVLGKSGLTLFGKNNTATMNDSGTVVEDAHGNKITMDASGIVIEDINGNAITMGATNGALPASPGINLNGSKKICLEGLIDFLMSHTHLGNMGAPCPLNPADITKLTMAKALPDGSILGQKVTAA